MFHDAISERLPEIARLGLEPAAAVLAHVVSHPTNQVATVNAGHKSVSADSGDPCCMVLGWPQTVPLHPSEEHMPIQVLDEQVPPIGELLTLIPEHVCPTVNLSRYAILCEDSSATVVPIDAAGHEAPLADASV